MEKIQPRALFFSLSFLSPLLSLIKDIALLFPVHAIISPSTLLRFLWSGARGMRKITLCIAPHTIFPCSLTRSQRRWRRHRKKQPLKHARTMCCSLSVCTARTPWCLLIFFIVAIISGFSIKLRPERLEEIFNLKHKTGSQRREIEKKVAAERLIMNFSLTEAPFSKGASVFFGLGYRLKLFPKPWMIFKDEKLPFLIFILLKDKRVMMSSC